MVCPGIAGTRSQAPMRGKRRETANLAAPPQEPGKSSEGAQRLTHPGPRSGRATGYQSVGLSRTASTKHCGLAVDHLPSPGTSLAIKDSSYKADRDPETRHPAPAQGHTSSPALGPSPRSARTQPAAAHSQASLITGTATYTDTAAPPASSRKVATTALAAKELTTVGSGLQVTEMALLAAPAQHCRSPPAQRARRSSGCTPTSVPRTSSARPTASS